MTRPDPRLLLVGGSVTAVVVVSSWVVRRLVEQHLALGESVSLIGAVVLLSRGENSGVAFGLLRGSSIVPWLSAAAVILIALLAAQQHSRVASIASGLIFGGGLANVIDRLADARVTDYIDVAVGTWHYPTFNLPDVAVTLGTGLLLLSMVTNGQLRQERVGHGTQLEDGNVHREESRGT